jgi:hypothetical protein
MMDATQWNSLKARAERAEARLQQLLEHGYPTWDVKGAPKSQWHERDAYAAVDHVLNVAEMYFSGGRRSSLLLARESWEALYGRAEDAKLELEAVVARAEAAEAASVAARAEGIMAERAAVIKYIQMHRDVADQRGGQHVGTGPSPAVQRFLLRILIPDLECGAHVDPDQTEPA